MANLDWCSRRHFGAKGLSEPCQLFVVRPQASLSALQLHVTHVEGGLLTCCSTLQTLPQVGAAAGTDAGNGLNERTAHAKQEASDAIGRRHAS